MQMKRTNLVTNYWQNFTEARILANLWSYDNNNVEHIPSKIMMDSCDWYDTEL